MGPTEFVLASYLVDKVLEIMVSMDPKGDEMPFSDRQDLKVELVGLIRDDPDYVQGYLRGVRERLSDEAGPEGLGSTQALDSLIGHVPDVSRILRS